MDPDVSVATCLEGWFPAHTAGPSASSGLLALVGIVLVASSCSSTESVDDAASLGTVSFETSCDPGVQEDFDRAVALLHHMTYPVAQEAFQSVAERDPDCAIAYWGMAMTLFQPLWPTRPSDADLARGWGLMTQARERGGTSEREDRFIAAGSAFFDPSGAPDYWTRIERWVDATTSAYEADPDDLESAAFFGLALLATSARSQEPAIRNARAAEVLLDVLAEEPTHPGGVHYTIHANDFDGRERESLEVVRRYGEIAPLNPHALHMPTHIFVRLGEWPEVIEWNRRAAEAALAQRVGPSGEYVWDEYPHAVEYLVYAHLQQGDDEAARDLIQDLAETRDLQPSFKTAFHLASTAARYALERRAWEDAAQLPPRQPSSLDWDQFPWPEAVVWYARGFGAAHGGSEATVEESLERLASLLARATHAGESLFASQIRILELEVQGWSAMRRGESGRAVALLEEAVALEDRTPKHPVTPGATLPAAEVLGDLYMASGEPESALEAYSESNDRLPGRLNTLLGLARASLALSDSASARTYYSEVIGRATESSDRPGVEEARAFVGGG